MSGFNCAHHKRTRSRSNAENRSQALSAEMEEVILLP